MDENTDCDEFYWPNIFFKVEDRIFCAPRCEFEESSEVFADMFLLPHAPGPSASNEGQDKEHPILLQGYKKDEFACLLKVMYPTARSLISGTKLDFGFGKKQWVNVLKLTTVWNMNKIREYAIHRLSTDFVLSPIEKIKLGRAHTVAGWLEDGVTNLVNDERRLTLEELATLGWETAALILWIREQWSISANDSKTLLFMKDAIKCGFCSSSASLIDERSCYHCARADKELSCPGSPSSIKTVNTLVRLQSIKCCRCQGDPFHKNAYVCSSCSHRAGMDDNVRITAKKSPNEIVKEVFGGEIRELAVPVT